MKKKQPQQPRLKRSAVYSTTKDGFTRNGKKVVVEKKRRQRSDSAASSPAR
jgi:hypothetical protein